MPIPSSEREQQRLEDHHPAQHARAQRERADAGCTCDTNHMCSRSVVEIVARTRTSEEDRAIRDGPIHGRRRPTT